MISITRNLDELFDYTQGLIRELQQKNNEIIIRSDTTKTATSPGIPQDPILSKINLSL